MIDTSRVDKNSISERIANQRSSNIKIVPVKPTRHTIERTRKDGKIITKYINVADLFRIYCSKILVLNTIITYCRNSYRIISKPNHLRTESKAKGKKIKDYYYYEAQLNR